VSLSSLTTAGEVTCVSGATALGECNAQASPAITKAIAATSTDGLLLANTTAATAGAQKWSPRLHFSGRGWKTDATAASQAVDWIAEVVPVQGAAAPQARLDWSYSVNGGGYTNALSFLNGNVGIGTATPARLLHASLADTTGNAVSNVQRLTHTNSTASTGGSAGMGVGLEFFAETATDTVNAAQAAITTAWTTATSGAEDGYLTINTMRAGTLTEAVRVTKDGYVGIGTTGPGGILHVVGGANKILFNSTSNSYGQVQIGGTGAKEVSLSYISNMTAFGNPPTSSSGNTFIWNQGVGLYSATGNQYGLANTGYGGLSFLADSNGGFSLGAYAKNYTVPPVDGMIISGNVGIGTPAPARLLHASLADTTTNAVSNVQRLTHTVSTASTGGSAGLGVGLEFFGETATDGTNAAQASIESAWTTATAGAEDGYLVFKTMRAGTLTEAVRVTKDGNVTFLNGTDSSPSINFSGDTGAGFYQSGNAVIVTRGTVPIMLFTSDPLIKMRSDAKFAWSSNTTITATADVGLSRAAANILEVNTGTAGVIATIRSKYQSSDGSAGVTGSTCTAWKDGLCTSP